MVGRDGQSKALEFAVKTCAECQENQKSPARAPMHPWEWPDRQWARIHIDYAGPVKGKMILVIVDSHSKWIEAHVVNSATSQAIHGLPEVIVSDNGPPSRAKSLLHSSAVMASNI